MRFVLAITLAFVTFGCGTSPAPQSQPSAEKKKAEPAKITQFYASDTKIPKGLKGNLCYGVEHATKVELNPAVDTVWPSPARCFEISPKQPTTYTLTAYGEDGSKDTKSVEVTVGGAPPRLYDLSVNATEVKAGEQVTVCFKVANAKNVKASPGTLNREVNCVMDKPTKTTTYKITALGADNEEDTGSVTVKVR